MPQAQTVHIQRADHTSDDVLELLRRHCDAHADIEMRFEEVTFSITEGDKLLGGIAGFRSWDMLEITHFAVTETGQGYGTQLLAELEAYCQQHGLKTIYLWTLDFQSPQFYEKNGFEKQVQIKKFVGAYASHLFIKRLGD